MKRTIYPIVCTLALLITGGCYADKGNYDYVEVNHIDVTFTPETDYNAEYYTYSYTYRQPPTDTLWVTYTAQGTQSLTSGDENLEYEWIVTLNSSPLSNDTISAKEITLAFPPKKKTTYDVRFQMKDNDTGVSVYRSLRMKTQVPFLKSWMVLHGPQGARRLGAIEYPDDPEQTAVLPDAYEALHDSIAPLQNINTMFYNYSDGGDYRYGEHLSFLAPEEFVYMYPMEMAIAYRPYDIAVPEPLAKPQLAYGIADDAIGRYAALVTEDGKMLNGGPNGFYYNTPTQPEVENYHIDKGFISDGGKLTLWDGVNKKFMLYDFMYNWYVNYYTGDTRPTGFTISEMLSPFPEGVLSEGEMDNRDVLWMGHPLTAETWNGLAAIVRDDTNNNYWAYLIAYSDGKDKKGDEGGESVTVTRRELPGITIDDNSCFATSVAFAEQIYYTTANVLYHYNMVTGENVEIYAVEPGETITHLKFRKCYPHDLVENENHKLAVVALSADGEHGYLHEVTLGQSGDITQTVKYDGDFGPISDIAFTFIAYRII